MPHATIVSSAVVTKPELPEFCQVQGVIEPNIRFEARLPTVGWNGKYYQSGCGGYCGSLLPDKPGFSNTINEALKRGYAAITTDGGHVGTPGDASWAAGNPEAVEVYAHRGIALTQRLGTALVEAVYETPASRRYFGGCSTGGRMAAMAAQRYPELFDGILGGGGVLNLSVSGGIYGSWVVQANTGPDGERILNRANFAAKLPALEHAVLEQCDGTDGAVDNVVSEPRNCEVDVARFPSCPAEEPGDTCFTDAERNVLAKWYQGPRNTAGEQLFPGMPPGSERFIGFWFLDTQESVAVGNQLGGQYAKYLGFVGGTADDYSAMDFDFDTDPEKLVAMGRLLDALDPDLRRFRDAGGKFLMWHGWADPLVLPDQSVDYYRSVADLMGGVAALQPFFQLFMVPGHGHCWELPAAVPDRFDPVTALDVWVETGKAPTHIPARGTGDASTHVNNAHLCAYPNAAVSLPDGPSPDRSRCP